jgi:hypothetical protein
MKMDGPTGRGRAVHMIPFLAVGAGGKQELRHPERRLLLVVIQRHADPGERDDPAEAVSQILEKVRQRIAAL